MNNVELDNRLYLLENTALPLELRKLVTEASTAYLKDNDSRAIELLDFIENECEIHQYEIRKPFY